AFCRNNTNLRIRKPTITDQHKAMRTAMAPKSTWLASVERKIKENAKPQQPRVTKLGIIRLSGPRTRCGSMGRAAVLVCAWLCWGVGVLAALLRPVSFLRFLAFGMTQPIPLSHYATLARSAYLWRCLIDLLDWRRAGWLALDARQRCVQR